MSNPVKEKKSIFRSDGFQSLLASLICIVLGLLIMWRTSRNQEDE